MEPSHKDRKILSSNIPRLDSYIRYCEDKILCQDRFPMHIQWAVLPDRTMSHMNGQHKVPDNHQDILHYMDN